MREPPKLADATIRAALHAHFDITTTALTFLALGNDAASFVYRADASDGSRYFLKVRAGSGFRAPSLMIPRFLYEQGIPHVITPLPTTTQRLWVQLGDFALTVYPLLEARTATDAGLTEQQWHALGATLQQIHTSRLPPDLLAIMPRDQFIPSRRHVLNDLVALLANDELSDPIQREFAAFWHGRQDQIRVVIDRADTLADQLRQAALPFVLCHADLHTWNVLVDTDQQMWIVDWDETILAPKERDLMFVIGGIGRGLVSARETECFLQGYGNPEVNREALIYYRYAWAVQDMAAYAEEIFSPELSEETRRTSFHWFASMFEPGNIIDIARDSDSDML